MPASPVRARVLFALTLVVPLAVYAAGAARFLRAGVGYEMDEAIYTESAVFMLRGDGEPPFVHEPAAWIPVGGRPWPLMIIPYVGATKAYATLPLFAVFGISTQTARLAGVALAGLGLVGLSTLIAVHAGLLPAFWTGLFLAIHPSYLDLTVFDNGGTAVWMGAMGLLALALGHHLRHATRASAFGLGLAAGLAVWARANLAWLLAAAIAAALILLRRRAVPPRRILTSMGVGGLLGASPLVWYELVSWFATLRYMHGASQPLTAPLLASRLHGAAEVMVADREQRVIWGGPPNPAWQVGLGAALLVLVAVAVLVKRPPDGDRRTAARQAWRRWFALTALLLLLILATSGLNVSQHHIAAILPLAAAALAILAVELAARARTLVPMLAAVAAALAVLLVGWDLRIDRGLRATGGIRAFSSAIDDVSRELLARRLPSDRLKVLNWGIHNNLYVVSGGAVHGTELFWGATKRRTQQGRLWDDEIRDGGAFLLFAFPMGPPSIGDGAVGFEEALARYPGPRTVTVFRERSGTPYARLVEIPAAH
ncbi:MAG TPA: hypothetical protein VGH97_05090 [Thermoanaerobaculia bacterium]